MSWWDQFWQDMGSVIGGALSAIVTPLLNGAAQIIAFTPGLNYPFVVALYSFTFAVFIGAMGIAIGGIGLLYILSPVLEKKVEYRTIWAKLFGALVIAVSAFLIGNLLIALANELTSGIFSTIPGCGAGLSAPGCQASMGGLWGSIVNNISSSGFLLLAISLIAIIFLITLFVENGIRILMIFFSFVLLPWGLLLWAFPTTQSYGAKLSKMFFEWVFVGPFMALAFTITVLMASSSGVQSNWLVVTAIFLGGLALVAAVPKIVTESGSAVSGVGTAVAGGVLGGTFAGFGEGGAGMMPMGGGMMPMGEEGGGGTGGGGGGGSGGWRGLGSAMRGIGRAGMMGVHNPMAAGGAVAGVAMAGVGRLGHAAIKHVQGRRPSGSGGKGGAPGAPGGTVHPFLDPARNRQASNETRRRIGMGPIRS